MKDGEITKHTRDVIRNVIINYAITLDDPKTLQLIERGVATCVSPWIPSEFDEIDIKAYSSFTDLCVDVRYVCNGLGSTGRPSLSISYIENSVLPNAFEKDEDFEFTLDDLDLAVDILNGSRELEL